MTLSIDYASPARPRHSRLLAAAASISLAYPLAILASLYGQWLLTTCILGHVPRLFVPLEEAGTIPGTRWLHDMSLMLVVFEYLVLPAGVVLNVAYVYRSRPTLLRALARAAAFATLWIGLHVLRQADPGQVWWWWSLD